MGTDIAQYANCNIPCTSCSLQVDSNYAAVQQLAALPHPVGNVQCSSIIATICSQT